MSPRLNVAVVSSTWAQPMEAKMGSDMYLRIGMGRRKTRGCGWPVSRVKMTKRDIGGDGGTQTWGCTATRQYKPSTHLCRPQFVPRRMLVGMSIGIVE